MYTETNRPINNDVYKCTYQVGILVSRSSPRNNAQSVGSIADIIDDK